MEFGFYTELFILTYRCRAGAASLIPLDTRMPGNSYQGPLPPFSQKKQTLRADLQRHVEELSGRTGERNMHRWDALQAAARYSETEMERSDRRVLSVKSPRFAQFFVETSFPEIDIIAYTARQLSSYLG